MYHDLVESERPEKRQRIGGEHATAAVEQQQADDAAPPPPPPAHDQISAALAKLSKHLSNKDKFNKASQLLRQLLDAVDKGHRYELFAAIKAAYANPDHCIDPYLRKEYTKLNKAISLRADGILSKQQRAQLEVYSIWGVLRNELFTDDSFAYNKVVAKIKATVAELSDGDIEQEAAWEKFHNPDAAAAADDQQQQAQPLATAVEKQQQATPPPAAAADDAEADPFGLGEFIAKQEAEAKAAEAGPECTDPAAAAAAAVAVQPDPAAIAKAQAGAPWNPPTIEVMKKQALLDCLICAKEHQHKLAWARTSVEILIEDIAKPSAQGGFADKFVGGQKQQLQDLLKFVNLERAARRSGVNRRPGGKSTGDYQTSFEKARAEWGSASWVSARGKVGSQGDAKSQNWLG